MDFSRRSIWVFVVVLAGGCAEEAGSDSREGNGMMVNPNAGTTGMTGGASGGGTMDAGKFGNVDPATVQGIPDAALSNAMPIVDAYFVEDPAPEYCGPEPAPPIANPGGSLACPGDKNREGCPCPDNGVTAACWPGKRANRNRGECSDGMTTCMPTDEFGNRWGPCEGAVLPSAWVSTGKAACNCFGEGSWTLDNLSPCSMVVGTDVYMYSSYLPPGAENVDCSNLALIPPPAMPANNWSNGTLDVDCAGQFKLCYTLKAGDVTDPQPTDCVISESCVDIWYPEAGVELPTPPVPAWTTVDPKCSTDFYVNGGYGEMSVLGTSIECDPVDDGPGIPLVFRRGGYCAPNCNQLNPGDPGYDACQNCSTGGSGMF